MYKATHNSGTGEKPSNVFAKLFSFIAKCQDLTIEEQVKSNVILYDVRIKWYKDNFYIYHGLARYDITFDDFLNTLQNNTKYQVFVMVTYEDYLDEIDSYEFKGYVLAKLLKFNKIQLVNISIKKPKWTVIHTNISVDYITNYIKIVGWKKLIPFPRFWNLFKKHNFGDYDIVMEDFIK